MKNNKEYLKKYFEMDVLHYSQSETPFFQKTLYSLVFKTLTKFGYDPIVIDERGLDIRNYHQELIIDLADTLFFLATFAHCRQLVFDFEQFPEPLVVTNANKPEGGLSLVWSKQVAWAQKIVGKGTDQLLVIRSNVDAEVILHTHKSLSRAGLTLKSHDVE